MSEDKSFEDIFQEDYVKHGNATAKYWFYHGINVEHDYAMAKRIEEVKAETKKLTEQTEEIMKGIK